MEQEIEFEHQANLQFKFIQTENSEDIFEKLSAICHLIDIKVDTPRTVPQSDTYYDDDKSTIKNANCLFRRRIIGNSQYKVTLKHDPKKIKDGALERYEYEFDCPKHEFDKLVSNWHSVKEIFKEKLGIILPIGKLEHTITVTNERTKTPLMTNLATYTFCYDKYYFFHHKEGVFSEYFYEIEVELESPLTGKIDHQIISLSKAINALLGFTKTSISKLERGISLSNHKTDSVENVFCICFDIVGYSKLPANIQKQVILMFNKITKECINKHQGVDSARETVYLPTGDGMILVFKHQPETLLPIIMSIQKSVKLYNTSITEFKFEFRTGLHVGPVFKYSDVNGNLNFAGNGINISQRVMSIGDEWHILASHEAYECLGMGYASFQKYFHLLEKYMIKHNQELNIYNIYYMEDGIGNPQTP
jgi:ubiquitin